MMSQTVACLGVALLGACALPVVAGQEGEEVLTNADVVKLTEAGQEMMKSAIKYGEAYMAWSLETANGMKS